jgi:integrase
LREHQGVRSITAVIHKVNQTGNGEGVLEACRLNESTLYGNAAEPEISAGRAAKARGEGAYRDLTKMQTGYISNFQSRFVSSRGHATPTGEPLYSYRMTREEFDDLESGIREFLVHQLKYARKPDLVLVHGKQERHPEGAYYLEWREKGRRIRLSVGKDPQDAAARRQRKEAELNALNNGVSVLPDNGKDGPRSIARAVAQFLEETELTKKPKTLAAYTTALNYFTESCPKLYLQDIERKDLLKFSAFLRDEKNQAPRSVYNKFENVMTFLKANGIRGLVGKNDWPRYTEEEPEMYEQEELGKLFKACDSEERLWYQFFLMTGMREQEVMYTYWSDINLAHATVRVSHKPDRGWTPKAYKEREIPIPAKLVKSLKAWKAKSDKSCSLVFPTAGCNPKLDFLDCLKAVAERAKLDADDFWLHKFRATFATRCLWAGVDLRTVQQWLGHSDMESTMRYLKPSRSQQTREKMNEIFA